MRGLFLLLLLSGCGASWKAQDVDGDGVTIAEGDCLEGDATVHPDAEEVPYNEVDENCDGLASFDADGDGHDAVEYGGDDCWDLDGDAPPAGFTAVEGAVQLQAAEVYPGAADVWYDGIDADCAGNSDFDQDLDGYELAAYATTPELGDCYDAVDPDCVLYDGTEPDCDYPASGALLVDGELGLVVYAPEAIHPGIAVANASDTIDPEDTENAWYDDQVDDWYDGTDQNCDGLADYDYDRDGYARDEECDDLDPETFPNGGTEAWGNCEDEDCDGNIADQDGDGWLLTGADEQCGDAIPREDLPYVGDCVDDPADTGAGLSCNGAFADVSPDDINPGEFDQPYDCVDADCSEGSDFDADGDGYDSAAWPQADGTYGTDCDDEDALVYPGAFDSWYDGEDSDCAGNNDYDQDYDGFTEASDPELSGSPDCDDLDADVNPGEREACATVGTDDDCSGSDNDEDAVGCTDLYADADGDMHADAAVSACICYATTTYELPASDADDCDDTNGAIYPGRTEDCATDGVDDNCDDDDNTRDADNCVNHYPDADNDGYGDSSRAGRCYCEPSGSYEVANDDDCRDSDASVYLGATETCDDVDDDCDGVVDDGLPTRYIDADGDGYGAEGSTADCSYASSGSTNANDCNDAVASIYLGAAEACNDIDDDCDDVADEGLATYYTDADADGYGAAGSTADCSISGSSNDDDCDDARRGVNPAATETCATTYDDDCDSDSNERGATSCTTRYYDADGDGYGTSTSECRCTASGDYDATVSGDCDDADALDRPGGTETCNSDDEDCDGVVDDGVQVYRDTDGDGYGDSADAPGCETTPGFVLDNTDCNDADEYLFPGGDELCDGQRNDCNISSGSWNVSYEDDTISRVNASGEWSAISQSPPAVTTVTVADGDEFIACEGTVYVRFNVNGDHAVTWTGQGSGNTTFDGGGLGPILDINGNVAATATGITFTNGAGTYETTGLSTPGTLGGAIYVYHADNTLSPNLELSDCVISGNSAGTSGQARGGGLTVHGGARVTLDDCVVEDNSAEAGGGIAVLSHSSGSPLAYLSVTNSVIDANRATSGAGGGIGVYLDATVVLSDVTISNNTATQNGGGVLLYAGSVNATDTILEANASSANGGGVFVQEGSFSLACTAYGSVEANTASRGGGAALNSSGNAELQSTDCDWGTGGTDNSCSTSGCGADVDAQRNSSAWNSYSAYTTAETFTCFGGSGSGSGCDPVK